MQMWLTDDNFCLYPFFQNAGEGPTEHVQKGAAADCLYCVSLGTADQCIVTQKPHRYNTVILTAMTERDALFSEEYPGTHTGMDCCGTNFQSTKNDY